MFYLHYHILYLNKFKNNFYCKVNSLYLFVTMKKVEENINEIIDILDGVGVPNNEWIKNKLKETIFLIKISNEQEENQFKRYEYDNVCIESIKTFGDIFNIIKMEKLVKLTSHYDNTTTYYIHNGVPKRKFNDGASNSICFDAIMNNPIDSLTKIEVF
jgi:predicted Zn-dependent peptidase